MRINEALYGSEANSSEYDQLALEQTWARFDVSLPIDVFMGWKTFLIEDQERSRLIIKQLDKEGVSEYILTKGEFDELNTQLFHELDNLYERELMDVES